MNVSPLAGRLPEPGMLANIPRLVAAYYTGHPDVSEPEQRVSFGTSGHRGSSLADSFNEDHILAISAAICELQETAGHRRTVVPRHGHARALRTGVRDRARSAHRHGCRGDDRPQISATRPRRRYPTRSSVTIADAHPASPTASSSRPRTTRPRTAASNTTRRMADPPTPTSRRWIQDEANRLLAAGVRQIARKPFEAALRRRHHASPRLHLGLRRRPPLRDRYGRDSRRAHRIGGGSARRRRRCVLGAPSPSGTG